MPYAKLEPSGCGIHKGRAKLRIDLFLEVGDPNYDKAHVFVVDETSPEFKAGYKGKLDAEGNPDPADYEKWLDGLPHVWRDNPFHSHFIYPDKDATDADIKAQIERTLNYFHTFHTHCWDNGLQFCGKDKDGNIVGQWEKVPKVKGSIRDIFVKGDPKDRVFNEQKVADVLSRVQEFQIGKTSIIPPPLNIGEKGTIDVGAGSANRSTFFHITQIGVSNNTAIDYNNAANAGGSLDTVLVWMETATAGNNCRAGTFTANGSASFTCHDAEGIGELSYGENAPITGLSIDISIGEYIGFDNLEDSKAMRIERDISGFLNAYYVAGTHCVATDTQTYSVLNNDALSLYGTGTESGGAAPPVSVVSSVQSPSVSGSGSASITPSPVQVTASVVAPAVYTPQTITASPVAVTASVQSPTLSGSGSAPVTLSPIQVVSSVVAPIVSAHPIARPDPVQVTASVQSPSVSGSGTATITLSPVSVASSVVAPVITSTIHITLSPVQIVSSVVSPTIVATGSAPITASPVGVASSVQSPSLSGTGSASIGLSPIAVISSVVVPVLTGGGLLILAVPVAVAAGVQSPSVSGTGSAPIILVPLNVVSSVVAPELGKIGRLLIVQVVTSLYRNSRVITSGG